MTPFKLGLDDTFQFTFETELSVTFIIQRNTGKDTPIFCAIPGSCMSGTSQRRNVYYQNGREVAKGGGGGSCWGTPVGLLVTGSCKCG